MASSATTARPSGVVSLKFAEPRAGVLRSAAIQCRSARAHPNDGPAATRVAHVPARQALTAMLAHVTLYSVPYPLSEANQGKPCNAKARVLVRTALGLAGEFGIGVHLHKMAALPMKRGAASVFRPP